MGNHAVKPIPEGYHSITPSLTVKDAAGAIEFYKRAFDAVEVTRAMAPDGKSIWHAELQIGDSRVMLNDEMPEQGGGHAPGEGGAVGFALWLYVEDVDAVWKRAVDAGATGHMPPSDQFWGDRFGGLTDPYGFTWAVATRVEDLSSEEMRRRGEAFAASQSG